MTEGKIKYEDGSYKLEVGEDMLWIIAAYKGGRLARHHDSVEDYLGKIERETQRKEYKPRISEILITSRNPDFRGVLKGEVALQGYRMLSADQSRGEINVALEQISDEETQRLGQRLDIGPQILF